MAQVKSQEDRIKRRAEVLSYMESVGPFSIPANTLAEKHGVTVKMIYNDRDYWIKKINFKKIDLEGRKLIMSLMKNMAITEELKIKGTPTERIRAIQASNNTAEAITKLMENYGFKEKIADLHEIKNSRPIDIKLIEASVEEIKNDKDKNKPKAKGIVESSG